MSNSRVPAATSKVQLTLMSLFRLRDEGSSTSVSPFVGAKSAWMEDGVVHLMANSVPFHNRAMDSLAPASGQGLLALFGIRDALQELQHWRTVARNAQAQFAYLQLQVDAGVAMSGVLTREALRAQQANVRFVNVRRCAAEMQKEWLAQFAQWVAEEGGDAQRDMYHIRQMARRPDLFERLLSTDADLAAVDVLVFPLVDRLDATATRQVAYLRAGARIVASIQGSDQVHVHVPDWMERPRTA